MKEAIICSLSPQLDLIHHLCPNTYLLSCDVVGASLYLAEGALANILADHVVADAAALRRLLLIVVSICRRGLPLGRQAATIWGRRRGCAVRHWVRRAGVLLKGPSR